MLTETVLWALSWLPPAYVGWSAARRLGIDGHLRPAAVCLGAILYAYGACLICTVPLIGMRPATVLVVSALGALVMAAMDFRSRGRQLNPEAVSRKRLSVSVRPGHILPAIGLVCTAGVLGWLFWLGIRLPPHFSDASAVHCAPALTWFSDRHFSWPLEGMRDETFDAVNGYLKLPHFLFYYNVLAPVDCGFMSMGQFEGLLLMLAAVWAICIEMGTGRSGALLACTACLSVSEILVEVLDCYVDVLVAATLAATLLGVLLVFRRPTPRRLAAFSLTCAAAMAVKATSLVQAGPVWALVMLWGVFRLRHEKRRDLLLWLGVSLGVMTLLGGYWYFACWIRFGNPLYPFGIRLMGHELAPGIISDMAEKMYLEPLNLNRWTALAQSWNERSREYSLGAPFAGLGPLFVIVGIPSFMIAVLQSVNRRRWSDLGWLATAVLMVFLHPSFWQPRYSIIVAVIGCVAIAMVVSKWGGLMRSLAWLVVLAGLAVGLARALPYQVSGHLMPASYWRSSLEAVELTHLAARQCYPDASPVQQKLLLGPEFSGKRILVDTDGGVGSAARRRMDSRLFHHTARDESLFLRDVLSNRIDFVYCREDHTYRGSGILEVMLRHPDAFREQQQLPVSMRLATEYCSPVAVEHLYAVDKAVLAAFVGRGTR